MNFLTASIAISQKNAKPYQKSFLEYKTLRNRLAVISK